MILQDSAYAKVAVVVVFFVFEGLCGVFFAYSVLNLPYVVATQLHGDCDQQSASFYHATDVTRMDNAH